MKNVKMDAALAYAAEGWRVHPLRDNSKLPRTKWTESATTDGSTISQWWAKWPDANIGIATGKNSVVVLDVDVKNDKDGRKTLKELLKAHGSFSTLMAQTPSGGFHLYLSPNAAHEYTNAVGFADGLDFRCDGGYVVAPPSKIEGDFYEWI